MDFAIYLLVGIVSVIVIYKGSSMLETSAENISIHYKLPPIVHGSLIVAVGSSFPELSSTIISTWLHGEFELGVSAVVGSAIFNILVIPALSGILSDKPLSTDKELIFKDAQFYLISVLVLFMTFALATIYQPVEGVIHQGKFTRVLTLIPIGTYLIYLFLQFLEFKDYEAGDEKAEMKPAKMWVLMILSLCMVVAGVEGLVEFCLYLGEILETRSFIWGISVMAIVTSLPDMVISIRTAKAGNSIVSLSNVLGSNIFDLLIALPAGVLVAGVTVVDFELSVPLMTALTAATLMLFVFMRRKLMLTKLECWIMLIGYAVFLVWAFTLK